MCGASTAGTRNPPPYESYRPPSPLPGGQEEAISAHEETSLHQNEAATEQQLLPEATPVVEEEARPKDSFATASGHIADIMAIQQDSSDKQELLGPPPDSEDTDALHPSQWAQHEAGMDKEDQVPTQHHVMEVLVPQGKGPIQGEQRVTLENEEPLQEPPPGNTESSRACNRHNKIPKTACYHTTARDHQQVETVWMTLEVVWNNPCYHNL